MRVKIINWVLSTVSTLYCIWIRKEMSIMHTNCTAFRGPGAHADARAPEDQSAPAKINNHMIGCQVTLLEHSSVMTSNTSTLGWKSYFTILSLLGHQHGELPLLWSQSLEPFRFFMCLTTFSISSLLMQGWVSTVVSGESLISSMTEWWCGNFVFRCWLKCTSLY